MRRSVSELGEWLTTREAVDQLGVSASTLRRWGERLLIPMVRTPGGHRRYSRTAVQELAQQLALPVSPVQAAAPALLPVDWQISHEQLSAEAWYPRFASPGTAKEMRSTGQRILGLLIQYLTRRNDDLRFLQEAREVGEGYGALAARSGATLLDSVEAFVFFRKSFSRIALQVPRVAHSSDADEIIRVSHRVDQFMDEVLAGMVAGYEATRTQALQDAVAKALPPVTE